MAIGQQPDDEPFDQIFLADDDLVDFVEQRLHKGAGLLDAVSSDTAYREVRAAFEAYSLLLFRDQQVSDDLQAAFSRAFGPLEIVKLGSVGAGTFYSRLNNLAPDGTVVPDTHRQALIARANQLWHTDSSFKKTPALASVLSARTVARGWRDGVRFNADRLGASAAREAGAIA